MTIKKLSYLSLVLSFLLTFQSCNVDGLKIKDQGLNGKKLIIDDTTFKEISIIHDNLKRSIEVLPNGRIQINQYLSNSEIGSQLNTWLVLDSTGEILDNLSNQCDHGFYSENSEVYISVTLFAPFPVNSKNYVLYSDFDKGFKSKSGKFDTIYFNENNVTEFRLKRTHTGKNDVRLLIFQPDRKDVHHPIYLESQIYLKFKDSLKGTN
ncbi:MAG: hypothetical protein KJ941_07585 [Bacteroidetes bacterium]|nr:hypothetical protein [Bacteroidota bacterium]